MTNHWVLVCVRFPSTCVFVYTTRWIRSSGASSVVWDEQSSWPRNRLKGDAANSLQVFISGDCSVMSRRGRKKKKKNRSTAIPPPSDFSPSFHENGKCGRLLTLPGMAVEGREGQMVAQKGRRPMKEQTDSLAHERPDVKRQVGCESDALMVLPWTRSACCGKRKQNRRLLQTSLMKSRWRFVIQWAAQKLGRRDVIRVLRIVNWIHCKPFKFGWKKLWKI